MAHTSSIRPDTSAGLPCGAAGDAYFASGVAAPLLFAASLCLLRSFFSRCWPRFAARRARGVRPPASFIAGVRGCRSGPPSPLSLCLSLPI